MRAAVIRAWGAEPEWDEVAKPEPVDGEMLVRVEVAALNRLDLTAAAGVLGTDCELPYVAGVEACGRVVDGPQSGRRVLVRGAAVGLGRPGCWAEFVAAPSSAMLPLPDDLDPTLGATFFQPTCAAAIALHDVAGLRDGEEVIVVGAAGAVGSQVVQQAIAAGAVVTGVVGHDDQLARVPAGARPMSATDADTIAALAAEPGATLLIDTVGGADLFERVSWVRAGGRVVPIGYLGGTVASMNIPTWLMRDVALLPLNMLNRDARARELAPALADQVARGDLTIDVERYEPQLLVRALARLRAGQVKGRAVMVL